MKLLFVDCCISQRGENSRTAALAKAYLGGLPERPSGCPGGDGDA